MIKIPSQILNKNELTEATGRADSDIDIEIARMCIDKSSMVLSIDIKLNFVMPRNLEELIIKRLRDQVAYIKAINIDYIYTGKIGGQEDDSSEAMHSGPTYNANGDGTTVGYRRRAKDEPSFTNQAGELVLLGKDFKGELTEYSELENLVASKTIPIIEGEVFDIESKAIKNGRVLITILVAHKAKTFCMKSFISNDKLTEINENLNVGDVVRARGHIEFDTFEHEYVMSLSSLKKVEKTMREDTYPGGRRVELHCHTRMSDNDGFNTVEDIVASAARWGQPAVAITDHGVVQSFPDAAHKASSLAKNGINVKVIYGLEAYLYPDEDAIADNGTIDIRKNRTYHIILLAATQEGLTNIYKLVSKSHIDYFYKKPRLPRSVIDAHREGIIIGSACEAGELYQAAIRGVSDEELDRIASYYDYLEIQPLCNNQFMVNDGIVQSIDDIIKLNMRIIACGDRLGKLTVATTDSHYPDKESAIYRNIIMAGIGFKDTMSDSLYLRTTDEMMEEFSYLGDRAEEIVITNTNIIASQISDEILPVPKGKFPPKIEGAEEELRKMCFDRARSIYGDVLPREIEERLDFELNSIISNGYAVMYIAAQRLVKKSNDDGYLVGSRGSVGSSFAATMAGITEVNPLPPHYVCPSCKHYIKSDELDKYDTGYDMPDKDCPCCGKKMKKEGLNIPFATFLGFEGNKEPDIDLNFAGEYQSVAHKYVGEIFGEKNVYKAGTVSTIAEKTAYGYVKHYLEDNNIPSNKYDISYLVKGCTGVKRTTGQHPGGIIVVPDDHDIYEFCPIQKPANNRDTDVITTHYDYHKIDENLLKLDILGHDGPQLIRHLQDLTGVDPMSIPFDDKETLSIFTSLDALKIKNEDYKFTHGTYAIPEFGTNFTRGMLDDIHPTTVSALIKMSGFSHGTDVWTNNAQDLLRKKIATIDEVISCRDDIMNFLIAKGLDNGDAFKIMEIVRKNKTLSPEQLENMKSHGVPDWYIWSCETLKYMFPRAHAAAYVMTSIRMAWFKVYYPTAFYAAWFTTKVSSFDAELVSCNVNELERRIEEIEKLGNTATATQKEQLIVLEVMYEMLSRGYQFAEPVLGVAEACKFSIVNFNNEEKVMLPFNAISGIGDVAAQSLVDAFNEFEFSNLEEVRERTKLTASNINDLKQHGLFEGLPDSAQMSIFDFQ